MGVRRGRALAYAGLALVFGGLSYAVGVGSVLGQRAEAAVLEAARFTTAPPPPLGLVSVPAIAIALVALAALALWAHGIARSLLVLTVPGLIIASAQLLKLQVIERPDLWEFGAENSFPSGHMTVFAALAGAALWTVPRSLAPLTAAAAGGLLGVVGWQLLEYGWHRPSDVIGALALSVLGFSLAVVVGLARRSRRHERVTPAVGAVNRVLGAALTLTGMALTLGGVGLTVAAGSLSSPPLLLAGAQVAVVGAGALTARGHLALTPDPR